MRSLNGAYLRILGATIMVLAFCASCSRDDLPTSAPALPASIDPTLLPQDKIDEEGEDDGSLDLLSIGELPSEDPDGNVLQFPLFIEEEINSKTGGEVSNGLMRVVIPPEALEQATSISILRDADYAIADFGPDGTEFKDVVELRFCVEYLTLNTIAPHHLSIYWWNEEAEEWKKLDSVFDCKTREVVAMIEHFSRYALSD